MSITVSGRLTADNSDVLQGTRLQTAPAGGILTVEVNAKDADGTNNFTVSLQLPNGDVPWDAVLVPGTNPALAGVIDENQKLMGSWPIQQGGHAVLAFDETGTTTATYRVTYRT